MSINDPKLPRLKCPMGGAALFNRLTFWVLSTKESIMSIITPAIGRRVVIDFRNVAVVLHHLLSLTAPCSQRDRKTQR